MANFPLLATGQQEVTGSAVALPALGPVNPFAGSVPGEEITIILSALKANAAPVYYGPAGVTSATGAELPAGAAVTLKLNNLDQIFIVGSGTDKVSWAVMNQG